MLINIVNSLEASTLTDRPRQRANRNLQLFLQLIKNIEWVTTLTVHLIDKDDNRSIAHTAHLHQLTGLCLNTLSRIDYDDSRVHRGESTISILAEILVTRSIKNVYLIRLATLSVRQIIELHHRS